MAKRLSEMTEDERAALSMADLLRLMAEAAREVFEARGARQVAR